MTAREFYERYNGKAVDIDGAAGVQCVDLFKAFTKDNYGIYNYNCTNGYASGLWIYRKDKPYYKEFVDASVNSLQDGDWVIWGDCKACPKSHVAMYYQGKFFGQNQNGKRYASLASISTSGVLGVLRPKMYIKVEPTPAPTPAPAQNVSIVDALNKAGIDSSYANRCRLAEINGIANYTGTAEQNLQMLDLFNKGQLKLDVAPTQQYLKANYDGVSIVDALKSIGVDSSYDYRAKLASVNGIANYSGTAEQNTELLNKLKNGTLIKA